MKIMFVANYMWDIYIFRGGVLRALIEDGHEVIAVAPDDKRFDMEKEIPGVKTIAIELNKRGMNPIEDLKLVNTLLKIYKKEKPDIIFHYTIKPNIYGTVAAKVAGIPAIAIMTGLGYSFVQDNLVSKIAVAMYKVSLKFAKEIWVLNEDDKKTILEKGIGREENIFILPGEGVDTQRFHPMPKERKDDNTVFLMVARAFVDKGFKEYENAARLLITKGYKNVEFWYLGALGDGVSGINGEYMDGLVKEGVLKYLGTTNTPENIMKEVDCIVLPSYREGISKTLMEGAAMGKPLIATDVTGCKEIIDDGKTGFLVKVKDYEDLADKMIKFLNMGVEKREKMGILGRKKILNEFDEKRIVNIYRDKLEKVRG